MRRPYLVALAVAVACGLAYLAISALRGGGDPPLATRTEAPPAGDADAAPVAEARDENPAPPARERPSLPEPREVPDTPDEPGEADLGPEAQVVTMVRLKDAHAAYRDGDYGKARAAAEAILDVMPRRQSARLVAAMSSCRMGDRESAQSHADYLERGRFETVRLHCLDENIVLRNPYTSPADAGPGDDGGGLEPPAY